MDLCSVTNQSLLLRQHVDCDTSSSIRLPVEPCGAEPFQQSVDCPPLQLVPEARSSAASQPTQQPVQVTLPVYTSLVESRAGILIIPPFPSHQLPRLSTSISETTQTEEAGVWRSSFERVEERRSLWSHPVGWAHCERQQPEEVCYLSNHKWNVWDLRSLSKKFCALLSVQETTILP